MRSPRDVRRVARENGEVLATRQVSRLPLGQPGQSLGTTGQLYTLAEALSRRAGQTHQAPPDLGLPWHG